MQLARQECERLKREEAEEKEAPKRSYKTTGKCTGPFSHPVIQDEAKNILSNNARQSLHLGPQAVFKGFANTLGSQMFKIADALPSKLGPHAWMIYQQFLEQARTADFKTWTECFPGLQELVNDAGQAKAEADADAERAEAEAAKPINQLLRAYTRYIYVKFCNEFAKAMPWHM